MNPAFRRVRGPATAALLAMVWGCSAIRFGPDEADAPQPPEEPLAPLVDLTGAYIGSVDMQGQRIGARLDLVQRAHELEALLRVDEVGLNSEGEGDVERDGSFAFEVAYDIVCPGTALLEGRAEEEGLRLLGTVTASDCTGTASGDFSFRRR